MGIDQPLTRRSFLSRSGLAAGAVAGVAANVSSGGVTRAATRLTRRTPGSALSTAAEPCFFLPSAEVEHKRTWMAWPAREDVWGSLLACARRDIAAVAQAVARYEPVFLIARPDQAPGAAAACGASVKIVEIVNDDCWMRDMGPLFLVNGTGSMIALGLNFNGWGNKQVHVNDAKVASEVAAYLGLPFVRAPFVSEGGAIEVDGVGSVLCTESSIINPNRNPGKSKAEITRELLEVLGASKVLWLPGLAGHDITDDHIDGLARFVRTGLPARVVVDQPANPHATDVWAVSERQSLELLEHMTDSHDRALVCLRSRESRTIPPGEKPGPFVNVYVNWYACNGAVLLPAFDDPTSDAKARSLVAELYPGRDVVQLRIDTLAEGGGGIHCVTQQEPAIGPREVYLSGLG